MAHANSFLANSPRTGRLVKYRALQQLGDEDPYQFTSDDENEDYSREQAGYFDLLRTYKAQP